MRSGPPGVTTSDVQLITSKTEQKDIHLNIKMFKNKMGKKLLYLGTKARSTGPRLLYKNQSTSILISLSLYADVRAYCSHVNIYCKDVHMLISIVCYPLINDFFPLNF